MLSKLARRVGRAIQSADLLDRSDRVAVAVSGGSDSVALVLLLHELASTAPWSLVGIVHVNHGLRPEAGADAEFCRRLAARLGLQIEVGSVDTREHMATARVSVESAARTLRYQAFEDAAARLTASVVVTGHTADDQAETLLLRLFAGTSLRGVAGVRARRGRYRRPLLNVRRAELRAYLAERGEAFRDDTSNQDEAIPRNRLRRTVMPVVETFAPAAPLALGRFAALAAEDDAELQRQADAIAAASVRIVSDGVEMDRASLVDVPRAVARRVVARAIDLLGGRPSEPGVRAVLQAAKSLSGRDACGFRVEATEMHVRLSRAMARAAPTETPPPVPLSLPGEARFGTSGAVVRAWPHEGPVPSSLKVSAGPAVAVQADRLRWPLTVRTRRPGDRFRPLGAPGARKLQDVLVDRKIPYPDRDLVPIVVDRDDRIVWVAGVALADEMAATASEMGVVILEFEKGRP
jgi:tRNA(Ile)-lysidine synthase